VNLIITDSCNRSCPYCFARGQVDLEGDPGPRRETRYIRLDDVDYYLGFLEASAERQLKLLGGEPSIHPELPEIVRRGLARGLSVTVFTNGLWNERLCQFVRGCTDERLSFLFNINEGSQQRPVETRLQRRALAIAGSRGQIGFNIHREDFDLLPLADLIDEFGLRREIRLGLAHPIVGVENACLSNAQLPAMGRSLVAQLTLLEGRDVLGALDCGFPLCVFEGDDLATAVRALTASPLSVCNVIIDVGPDLKVWPCFPLSQTLITDLRDFRNRDELLAHYSRTLAPLRSMGSMDECIGCKYLRRGQCSGGCLARGIVRWQSEGDPQLQAKLARLQ
jgi:radical SAM protein with 4Fe4S-binding SPASM domain